MSATNRMEGERHDHHHRGGPGEVYRECLRNHAASLGSYATDGCGEFTPDVDDDSPLQCAACGCHRSFHRKVPPPPFPALLGCYNAATVDQSSPPQSSPSDGSVRRRSRTKFTGEQKEKMKRFAEKLGWRMQRRDEAEEAAIEAFCADVGVSRQVFKVWMHNHKSSAAASSTTATAIPTAAGNRGGSSSLTQS